MVTTNINNCLNRTLEWIFPRACLVCEQTIENGKIDLCEACENEIPRNSQCCPHCAEPATTGQVCGRCQKQPPLFDSAFVPFKYGPPLDKLIQSLKYQHKLHLKQTLLHLFEKELTKAMRAQDIALPDCIIPVPLHKNRLRERGFNQACELARPLAKTLDITFDQCSAKRIRDTARQIELPVVERRANVRNAFKITSNGNYHHVVLFDDVMTTGSTANEMAKALRKTGIKRIDVWVIARA